MKAVVFLYGIVILEYLAHDSKLNTQKKDVKTWSWEKGIG